MALTPEEEAELAELEAGEQAPQGGGFQRAAGLATRSVTPQVAGATAGAALGSVVPGVGTMAGAGAGFLAMSLLEAIDNLGGTDYIGKAMDKLGLPRPESPSERVADVTMKGMVGAAGMTQGAKALSFGAGKLKPYLEQLAANPRTALVSGATSGGAGGVTAESGGGPLAQMAASTAASLATPGALGLARKAGHTLQSTTDVIGAAGGHKGSINRLLSGVASERAGADLPEIKQHLQRSRTPVPGARPTVGEVIAGANSGKPRQMGGALVKLQDDLHGARGVEDVLPSAVKRQDVAIREFTKNLEAKLAPRRVAALKAAGAAQGIDGRDLAHRIKWNYVEKSGNSMIADKVVPQVLKRVQEKTVAGTMHPDDIYALRNDLRGMIDKQLGEGGSTLSAKNAAAVEIGIKRMLDDAIEAAGGTGWKKYMRDYSKGLNRVDQHQARRAEMAKMVKGVQGQNIGEMAREHAIKPPTLLHRPMMLLNFALKSVGADANEKLVREMAKRMQDPRQFAQLLKMPEGSPARQTAAEVMSRAGLVAGLIARHQEDEGLDEPVQ